MIKGGQAGLGVRRATLSLGLVAKKGPYENVNTLAMWGDPQVAVPWRADGGPMRLTGEISQVIINNKLIGFEAPQVHRLIGFEASQNHRLIGFEAPQNHKLIGFEAP